MGAASDLTFVTARAALASSVLKGQRAAETLRKEGALPAPGSPAPAGGLPPAVDFQGIQVVVDRPRGTVQKGVDPATGEPWVRVYHVDYGHIEGTRGGDEHAPPGKDGQLDVYLGLWGEAREAHWVLQKREDGAFDEYKVMLGFVDADVAKAMYLAHTPKRFFGSMASTSVEMMKALLGIRPAELMKVLKGLAGEPSPEEVRAAAETASALKSAESLSDRVVPFRVLKDAAGNDMRYLLGLVLVPDVVDAQGDTYSKDEVRKACWGYNVNFRNVGLMHKGLVNGKVDLVESYIAPVRMDLSGQDVPEGTWLMGLRVNDDGLWADVRAGKLTGLSIGGFAKKEPLR